MSAKLSLIKNPACGRERPDWMDRFTPKKAEQVRAFHRSLPEYGETPLRFLPALAERLGVSAIAIKDESARFGLGAFKGLGGSYCVSRYQAGHPGEGPVTFVTATDGNHGRGIAWAAQRMGCRAVVYMPAGSAEERLENIRALGAEASRTSLNYDDTVRYASSQAAQNGWVLVQDTSWPGYEEIPALIMQGYLTMADEAADQLEGRCPPISSCRPAWERGRGVDCLLPLPVWVWNRVSSLWSRTRLTAVTGPLLPTMAGSTVWRGRWIPSWRGLPAANPAPSAGNCSTMGLMRSFPWRTPSPPPGMRVLGRSACRRPPHHLRGKRGGGLWGSV